MFRVQFFKPKSFIPTQRLLRKRLITPQHQEIIKYINDSWNIVVAQNPYDRTPSNLPTADANNNTGNERYDK
uniref:Uncharacterized protein n=1 Tax=Glossina pallidipes TaxID=7398 RepID=A0A1A9ZLU3_GLOPL